MRKHEHADAATCPWCGHQHESCWDWDQGEHNCYRCGRPFEMERILQAPLYTTERVVPCPACGKHVTVSNRTDRIARHNVPGKWDECPCRDVVPMPEREYS